MKDHFSTQAAAYAGFRPGYPPALFDHLARLAPQRALACDCATGSGQAAVALAERFDRVIAVDGSLPQLRHAEAHPRVTYLAATAERLPLPARSVDLLSVAQALHWFDLPAFHREAHRVVRPGGVVAVWSYALTRIDPAIDPLIDHFYRTTVGPWWPPERALVESGYRDLPFPFATLPSPGFDMGADWSLDHLLGYLGSWSATTRCRAETGRDPLLELAPRLQPLWGPGTRRVRWPLALRVGRVDPH